MFDGGTPSAPVAYQLSQSVSVPSGVSAATLSWSQSVVASFSGAPRVLAVEITNAAGDTILDTIRSTDYLGSESTGWTSETEDLTANLAALEGQTVNLRFSVYISENWTGPAGLGLDSVSLDITAAPQSPPAPVPTMSLYGLLATALGIIFLATPRLRRHFK
ncbi:hypothetical protein DWB85_10485 [Seongchinamella sediminis]|uniref:Uncharacterized protein n=2 Tax=Seongchinamella sediminis TaxID=2283635 RepID=A0A3L7E001_9GAMM|nr:hypothetical protein DWB85_10485 [Seongchinamella sediminis]